MIKKLLLLLFFVCSIVGIQAQGQAPTFTSTAVISVIEGNPYNYSITTNDLDGDVVTVTGDVLPSWLTLKRTVNVTTLAGSTGGFLDGTGAAAKFHYPTEVAVGRLGNVYVADLVNSRIRKITPAGVVTTLAGSGGGFLDGTGTATKFSHPRGIAVDVSGNVYVADTGNSRIRKITPAGLVTTIAGSTAGFSDGTGTAAKFSAPFSVAVDALGNVYVADRGNHKIRKITSEGVVTTLAGSTAGFSDGTGAAAKFYYPSGVAVDASGNIYVADSGNYKIRKISPTGLVTTIAGSIAGFLDGTGAAAKFDDVYSVDVDVLGNVYVADLRNHRIRKITPAGVVTTIAGSEAGFSDGIGTAAKFTAPYGVAVGVLGDVYVAGQESHKIRKIVQTEVVLTGDTTGNVGAYNVVLKAADGNEGTATQSFTITVKSTPTVTTSNATLLTENTAKLGGEITADGGAVITERGFVYSITATDSDPVIGDTGVTKEVSGTVGTGVFTSNIIGLTTDTQYSFKAYATNSVGTSYGAVQTFTTAQKSFITVWKTTMANESITIPITAGYVYNYTVDWGDGSTETNQTASAIHTYATASNHTVKITGTFPAIYFNNLAGKDKIIDIQQWGAIEWESMKNAFKGCSNLNSTAMDVPNLTEVTDMSGMFSEATSFNGNISSWSVSKVTDMSGMFSEATSFNGNISSWNVSSVTDMSGMFSEATSFNGNISSWNVSSVTDMSGMFASTVAFNQDLSSWNVSNVTDMSGMFSGTDAFNQDLSRWSVSKVTDMSRMFIAASVFNQDLSSWDVSNVTDMSRMFMATLVFNQALNWGEKTSKVINMSSMFFRTSVFNQDLSSWNVSSVTDMSSMFLFTSVFNQDLSSWKVSSVIDMNRMFMLASDFNQDLSKWNLKSVTNIQLLLYRSGISNENYDKLLAGWAANLNTPDALSLGPVPASFCKGKAGKTKLIAKKWVITDAGEKCPLVVVNTSPNNNVLGVTIESDLTITFSEPIKIGLGNILIKNSSDDSVFQEISITDATQVSVLGNVLTVNPTNNFELSTRYYVQIPETTIKNMSDVAYVGALDKTSFSFKTKADEKDYFITVWETTTANESITIPIKGSLQYDYTVDWGDNNVERYKGAATHSYASPGKHTVKIHGIFPQIYIWYPMSKTQILEIQQWGAIEWESMYFAFEGCVNLTSTATDVPNLVKVTNMLAMFSGATSFNGDLSGWDVSTVTNMRNMFFEAPKFNGDISKWDVSSVSNMYGVFAFASSFNGDISKWDVSAVTNMNGMFYEARLFNGDISKWDVSAVTDMYEMFQGKSETVKNNFNQDVSKWNISKVTEMGGVFINCKLSTANYDNLLNAWSKLAVQPGVKLGLNATYCAGKAGKTKLIAKKWVITDAGEDCPPTLNSTTPKNKKINVPLGTNLEFSFDKAVKIGTGYIFIKKASDDSIIVKIDITDVNQVSVSGSILTINPTADLAENTEIYVLVDATAITDLEGKAFDGITDKTVFSFKTVGKPFITVWKTTTVNESITIPINGGYQYNYTVDWGDGTIERNKRANATHEYDAIGYHTVKITGAFPAISFINKGDKEKIINIQQWGDIEWKSMSYAFDDCSNLKSTATDVPNLREVTNMSAMFRGTTIFNGDISNWNVSSVTNMRAMFSEASSFNGDVSNWNVSSVTDMINMFSEASSFNGDISNWNVSSVTDMRAMFWEASSFNGDISNWNVSSVTYMSNMFWEASSFNGDISNWDVSKVTKMVGMFGGIYSTTIFNQDISDWNVSNVTDMSIMFQDNIKFNQDLSKWSNKLTKVTNMSYMFTGAVMFNGNVSNWDVSNVEDMEELFLDTKAFDQDLSKWNVSKVKNMKLMFDNSVLSTENYDKLLNSWSKQVVQEDVIFGATGINFCKGEQGRNVLIDKGWKITDAGKNCPPTLNSTKPLNHTKNVALDVNLELTFDKEIKIGTGNIIIKNVINDSVITTVSVTDATQVSVSGTKLTINPMADLPENTEIYVLVDATAITDLEGKAFDGIKDRTVFSFKILKQIPPAITFNAISKIYGNANFDLSATSNSLGGISYTIVGVNTTGVTLSGVDNKTVTLGNAGSVTIRATQVANGIYAASTKDITITIGKVTITATADNKSRDYGAINPVFTVSYTGFINGETSAVLDTAPTVGTIATAATNVGTVDITIRGALDDNYNITETKGTLTIGKAVLTAIAEDKTRNYGDANPTFTVSYTGFKNGDSATVLDTAPTVGTIATAATNVGTVDITVRGALDTNYNITETKGTLTIGKAMLTAMSEDKTRNYGEANPAFTISYTGFKNGDSATVLDTAPTVGTIATAATNVGTVDITIRGALDDNYNITETKGTLTIGKAMLTAMAEDKTRNYGEANPAFTISYTGFKNGDSATVLDTAPTVGTIATAATNVGTVDITVTGALDDNYNIIETKGTLTIGKAALTAMAEDKTRNYGDLNPAFTVSYTGFKNGDSATVLDTAPTVETIATAATNVGTVDITVTGALDTNYNITETKGTLTIGKAALTATAEDKTRNYGEANPAFTISYTGFKNGDSATVLATAPTVGTIATAATNVGTVDITIRGALDDNYNITETKGTLTIGKAMLTATAEDKTRNYGEVNPVFTVSYTGFINGETSAVLDTAPTVGTMATIATNVGTVDITVTGALDDNYNIVQTKGILTIGKAMLTATAEDKTRNYGEANPAFTISYTGFKNGDSATVLATAPTVGTIATAATNVGTVDITIRGALDDNYNITETKGTLTIGKAMLTATAENKTRNYGEANPAFTISYSGFKNGDSATVLDTAPTVGTIATAATNVGTVDITIRGALDDNYNITETKGTLTIGKAMLTATAENKTRNYGEANPAFTISYTGFKNGDSVTVLDTAPTVGTIATAATNVGTVDVTVTGALDTNYNITETNGTLTIGKAVLTATAEDKTRNYGDANPAFTISYTGFKNGETAADLIAVPTASSSATLSSDAGQEDILLQGGISDNYDISIEKGMLTILVVQSKVMTLNVTSILTDTAVLHGEVTVTGGEPTVIRGFVYSSVNTVPSINDMKVVLGTGIGSFSKTITGLTSETTYYVRAFSENSKGLSYGEVIMFFAADFIAPNMPVITAISDYSCAGDMNVTGDNTLLVVGTAEANALLHMYVDFELAGTVTVNASGNWIFDHTAVVLADGDYVFTATATDTANNISELSDEFEITINTLDTDGDGNPDFCDEDDDNDGVPDEEDNSVLIPNSDQKDINGNGVGDVEEDCDNDGIVNYYDTDSSSCTAVIQQKNKYGFSPNNDGINDTWTIENIELYPNNTVRVFNRSGRLIYEKKGYKNTWNAVSNKIGGSTKVPVGPYLFVIELNKGNQKPIQGWLYINY